MATMVETAQSPLPWWKEPTKDQWLAWVAAWLGWTLDAFDFTIFLLIMLPISQEFQVPLTEVTAVFTITLWMRLVGAVSSGWLGDRLGRRLPLMISILGYSLCNFIAGFSPTFWFLFLFRALLGFFMGAEWPAGAALAMEQWPQRSRGLMSGVLQGSWGIGFLLSSAVYGLLFNTIGWRGCLWIGVLPALTVVYVRYFVKEPPVWVENRRIQRTQNREVRMPLLSIFKRSRSLTTSCVGLELRPLPSTGVTQLHRYYEPLRHPSAPGLSLTGVRLIIPAHALGLPVLRALSLCTCCRHCPGAADGRTRRSKSPIRVSLPRFHYRVGLHIVLFEVCSAFTQVAACTLAQLPNS